MTQWLDIESAPRDGETEVLAYCPSHGITVGFFSPKFFYTLPGWHRREATKWQPLPEPPTP